MSYSFNHHYPYLLNSGGSKFGALSNIRHLGKLYDPAIHPPGELVLAKIRRHAAGGVQSTTNKNGLASGISESIAVHQRKLRDTEARIDRALDLVTRSFGVTQSQAAVPRYNIPPTSELRNIRETLNKTMRLPATHQPQMNVLQNALEDRRDDPFGRKAGGTTTTAVNKRSRKVSGKETESRSSNKESKSQQQQKQLKIYKTKPVITPVTVPPAKKTVSKEKIDRNKVLNIAVVLGNTHIAEQINNSSDVSNTFARMETIKDLDKSNPANLPRFRSQVDMSGFSDNEISFQCDGKKLMITGSRLKKNFVNARKVVEVMELPPGVFPEKLRIARDKDGVLNIEERWTVT